MKSTFPSHQSQGLRIYVLSDQRPPKTMQAILDRSDLEKNMRVTRCSEISLPKERIHLYRWVTEMTDADYASFVHEHKAMGSYFKGRRFCMANFEMIGNEMIVQGYVLREHQPDRLHKKLDTPLAPLAHQEPLTSQKTPANSLGSAAEILFYGRCDWLGGRFAR